MKEPNKVSEEEQQRRKRMVRMQEPQQGSEIARLLHTIQREYEAAEQGLSGLAQGTARHQWITARLEQMHRAHEQLEALIGPEDATTLIAHTIWTPEERGTSQ